LEKINLNAFVTRIFSNHIQWERYERKMGLLPMTKPFLKEVINQLTNDQIINLAQKIEKENFKNILIFMNESHDLDDFVEILRTWLTVSWMQHNIVLRNGSYHFNIQHDLGYKWSLYVQTLVSELSNDILQRRAEIKITDNVISIVFPRD
jgi:K+-transporting ATPase A subunit